MSQALLERIRLSREPEGQSMDALNLLLTDIEAHLSNPPKAADPIAQVLKVLSYSEIKGMQAIAGFMATDDGLFVSCQIADGAGITRSTIVSAVRKFESAGVFEANSLGMKGTHIRTKVPGWREKVLAVS